MNEYAESARLVKAFALAQGFADVCRHQAEHAGEPEPSARDIWLTACDVERDSWDDLAVVLGIHKPSDETVRLTIRALHARAHPIADPFEGLPS